VVVIGLPALLMTLFFTRSVKRTLLLNRPRWLSLPLVMLLAVAIHPIIQGLGHIAARLYPLGPEAEMMSKMMQPLLNTPHVWLPYLLIALLPALCEEIAFRGFILSGLRHLGHKWWAIGLTAMFFGIVHGMLQQSLVATVNGTIIGYIAVQTGSLWPCIFYHFSNNSLVLLSSKLTNMPSETYAANPELSLLIERITTDGTEHYVFAWPAIIVGAIIAAYILTWFHRLPHYKSQEEELQEALDQQSIHFLTG
jgi:sodium transport system permease protein